MVTSLETSKLSEPNIINGKEISNAILNEIKLEMNNYKDKYPKPLLTVIQIGIKTESSIYIKKKIEACKNVGFEIKIYNLDQNINYEYICKLISDLNNDNNVNGIIIQLPIPKHLNEDEILSKIDYRKDVDGFHALNIGNLALDKRSPMFTPCTPLGCIEIFKRENIELCGKHIVVIGKSNIVGLPLVLLLLKEMATVTVCHIETTDIKLHTLNADIIISACGQPQMIKRDWINSEKNVIAIDIGINTLPDSTKKSGYRLVGDIDFDNVKDIVHKITPVPNGVGPMTVAMLMSNLFKSFKYSNNI